MIISPISSIGSDKMKIMLSSERQDLFCKLKQRGFKRMGFSKQGYDKT